MLLAVDCSAGSSVALVADDGTVLARRADPDPRRHAEAIGALLTGALADAGATPDDVSAVVAGMGPGPFTGLRVGIAAARAFARGAGVPVLTLVSHDAVAITAGTPVVVVTDARRRELAWSAYGDPTPEGAPVRFAGPFLAPAEGLDAALDAALGDRAGLPRIHAETIDAGHLGHAAALLQIAGPVPEIGPVYLRAPDVTLSAPKRVSG